MLFKVLNLLITILSYVPVYIYNLTFSSFYSKYPYYMLADRLQLKKNIKSILDVGIGTGHPMRQIIDRIPRHVRVVGIDIDKNYLRNAVRTFKQYDNVLIREQNFYDLQSSNEMFDVIIFSSSFMILPDRLLALKIAKSKLNKGGSIFFLITMEQKITLKTKIIEKIKPYLKYITTIDFGQITYEKDFTLMLNENQLNITYKEIVAKKSLFLAFFTLFVVETETQ
ncbi:hypothetical protein pb186bvf_001185 [Paramecium bursaria]